jgi:ABC-type dipeptide/oligopeptide/nickel transport system permease component
LLLAIPVLFGASILVFVAVFALPGDAVTAIGGQHDLPAVTRLAIERKYHLEDPLPVQYWHYIADVMHGDFGTSYVSQRPVRAIIGDAAPNTAKLAVSALVLEALLGIGIGITAAIARRRWVDGVVVVLGGLAVSLPVYVLATAMQYAFGLKWRLFPISGTDGGIRSWILPAVALAIPSLAFITRLVGGGLRESLRQGYVEMAVAKGASRARVVTRHVLKNSLVPVIVYLGVDFAGLLGGALFIESIFNIPGLGNATVRAISQRDNTVVLGVTTLFILTFVVVNLAADLVAAVIDPRLRDG